MDALDLLLQRSSMPRLIDPPPNAQQLHVIRRAAVRVPDHMALSPYRFIEYQEQGRQRLGDIFAQAAAKAGKSEDEISKAQQQPMRAPLIIAVCTRYQAHDKVPAFEQLCSAACAAMAMQQAAFAQDLGAIWRTGWLAQDDYVNAALGCQGDDHVIGFLYIGTPAVPTPIKPEKDYQELFEQG